MADAMIPAIGRDFAESPLFHFAAGLVRTHAAAAFRERPIDPPELASGPAFEDLPRREQLTIAETACARPAYRQALEEALPESDGYDGWLEATINVNVSDAEIGRRARELILEYLSRVAAVRGDDLAEEVA